MEFARRLFAGAFLLGVAAGQVAAQENLGRLFFSEQQRQDLDRRRQANVQETAAVVENTVTVNGQVSRSSGKSTTWINGVPQANARRPHDPARVTLPRGEGAPSVSVKIGQTLDKVRGEIRDPVAGGKITTPSGERERKP
ncbi:MAG TPA: hypothetical protein VEL09_09430 [Burkholderiales bacterium]|nr:hypothetical protein [Burkholderiales bacterium]